jgi:ribosomal protein S12 methylthiotransferase
MKKDILPRVGFVSLGCPRNLVDTEVMLGWLERHGFRRTGDAGDAEVIVVNTCGFIDPAKRESIDTILEMAQHKRDGACRRLVVTGCLSQRYGDDLRREIPEIDALIGVADLDRIVEACRIESAAASEIFERPGYLPDHLTPRVLSTPRGSAYLKISEGCDHECSFCVIPKIRGKMRSRPIASLLAEARQLAGRGVRELNLVGEDTSSFGRDGNDGRRLGGLLRGLAGIDGLDWIRILYAYPFRLGDDVLEAMAASDRICNYIDVPLQHADRDVLRRMRRGGDADSLLRFLERLRTAVPGLTIRSTFIVGFPGETDTEFESLLGFLRAARLDRVGAFTYWHEESTTAYDLDDDVPQEVKDQRLERLMLLQQEISLAAHQRHVDTRQTVLIDSAGENGDLRGRLESQAPEVDGCVRLDGGTAAIGSFVTARIESADPYDLIGRIVEPNPARIHEEPV